MLFPQLLCTSVKSFLLTGDRSSHGEAFHSSFLCIPTVIKIRCPFKLAMPSISVAQMKDEQYESFTVIFLIVVTKHVTSSYL